MEFQGDLQLCTYESWMGLYNSSATIFVDSPPQRLPLAGHQERHSARPVGGEMHNRQWSTGLEYTSASGSPCKKIVSTSARKPADTPRAGPQHSHRTLRPSTSARDTQPSMKQLAMCPDPFSCIVERAYTTSP